VAHADLASISRIDLTRPSDDDPGRLETITLEKRNGEWRLTSPLRARADPEKVRALLANLETLHLWKVVDPGTVFYEQYDLTEAKALRITAWKGPAKATEFLCGKGSVDGQLVRLPGIDGIFALVNWGPQSYAGFLYTQDVRSWRDLSILAFDPARVTAVDITNAHGVIRLARTGDGWRGTLADGRPWPRFDPRKVQEFLTAYHALSAEDFGTDADRSTSGIDEAERQGGVVRVSLGGGVPDQVLRVGRLANKDTRWAIRDSRWATRDGDDTLYVLAPWPAAWALASARTFERR
jgi:hypothetical protein